MVTKPGKKFESLISILALLVGLPSQSWASGDFYREFLSDSGIVSVSGKKIDDSHARATGIQIAHDQYREIRVLDPNTGATEVLQFSDPDLEVTYSLPARGKYLKLQIKRREKEGIRTADLLLASDGSRYVPVRNYVSKYQKFQQTMDFNSVPVCQMPRQVSLNKPEFEPAIDPFLNKPENIAIKCLSESCKQPPFNDEYPSMISGMSEVIASRDSGSSKGDRFLSCLSEHKLDLISDKLTGYFNDSLKSPIQPTVECQFRDNGNNGEYFQSSKTTYFWKPCSYGSCSDPGSNAAAYYADTFFHESLHRVGIEKEDIVVNVVSCCGSKKDANSPSACQRVDQSVAQTNERNIRLKAASEKLVGFNDFWLKIEKATDEQRANTFYDDFFEMLKSTGGTGGKELASCVAKSENSQEACVQEFVGKMDDKITKYFDSVECPHMFKDKAGKTRIDICQNLKTDALKMLQTNVSNVCDSKKTSAFERSCLSAMISEEKDLLNNSKGTLIADPDIIPNGPEDLEQKRARDSFLTAYAHQIPPLQKAYNEIKEKYDDDRTNSLLTAMLDFVGKGTNQFQSEYKSCLDAGESKESCANKIKHEFINGRYGLNHFFRRTCPTYFTNLQRSSKPCGEMLEKISKVFEDSFAGGCKTEDKSKQIGVPGNDLTCLFSAIDEGKYIYAHYDEYANGKKIIDSSGKQIDMIDSSGRPMTNASAQEAKQVAGNAAKGAGLQTKSFHIGDQDNKQIAHTSSSSSAGRSPSSNTGSTSAFVPIDGFDQTLINQYNNEPSPVRKVLQEANQFAKKIASDVAVPNAEASTSDTSSLVIKTPQQISTNISGIGGDLENMRALDIGSIDPYSFAAKDSRRGSRSATTDGKDRDSGTNQASSPQDRSPASSSPSSTSSSSTNSKSTRSDSSKSSAHGGSKAATSGSDLSRSSATSSASGDLLSRQRHILELFKNDPELALKKLKIGSVTSELISDQIEAKDERGHSYGSKSPMIKIWYDRSTRSFLGLPEL